MDHKNQPDTPYSRCRRAAEEGNADAQNELSVLYSKGYGVAKNEKVAFKWCKLAAEQGYAFAAARLATLLYAGTEVEKDLITAYKWIKVALKYGELKYGDREAEDLLSKIEQAMNAEEKKTANLLVSKFVARPNIEEISSGSDPQIESKSPKP